MVTTVYPEVFEGFDTRGNLTHEVFHVDGFGIGLVILANAIAGLGFEWLKVKINHFDLLNVHGRAYIRPKSMKVLSDGWVLLECTLVHQNLISGLALFADVEIRYEVLHQTGRVTLPNYK